jgi:aspartyl-tRNA(Asn)/glutamyl-tRNA(Gln) amidotransferase subunit C
VASATSVRCKLRASQDVSFERVLGSWALTGLRPPGTMAAFPHSEAPVPELPDHGEITAEIFEHLVQLASFDLTAEEADYLRRQLNGQLQAIRELEAIELEPDVPITSHGVPYAPGTSPAIREDTAQPGEAADDILAQAPETEGRYVVVPDIPHTELE